MCVCAQSCLTLCNPIDYSPPGSSVHESFQLRILEWVAISYFRGSSQLRDWICVSYIFCIDRKVLNYKRHLGSPYSYMSFDACLINNYYIIQNHFTALKILSAAPIHSLSPHQYLTIIYLFTVWEVFPFLFFVFRNSIRQTVVHACPTPCHARPPPSKAQHLYTRRQTKLFVNKVDYISGFWVHIYIYIYISVSIYVVFFPSFLSMLVFQCLQFFILFQVYVYIIMKIPL